MKLKAKIKNFFKNKKNSKNFIIISTIIAGIAIIAGTSYAYVSYTLTGTEDNLIKTGCLKVDLTEANAISLSSSLPMSDTKGQSLTPYTFTITNSCTTPASYEVNLGVINTSNSDTLSKVKVSLGGDGTVSPTIVSNLPSGTLLEQDSTISNVYSLTTGFIDVGESKSYQLRMWIDYDVTSMTGSLNSKIIINATAGIPKYLYNTIANQVQTTSVSYSSINGTSDNGVFKFSGTDDNGGSNPIYYYRGNVTNNNVLFADLCWKIVRTTSTGGVKLIYNGEPTDGTCDNTGEDSQYGTSTFNSNFTSPADVGYMYGTRYTYSSKTMTSITDSYVYGKTVTYSNGTYTLNTTTTSTGSSWSTDRTTLANGYHYTCFSTSSTCSTVYYITYFGYSSTAYYLTFTGGVNLATAKSQMYTNTTNSTIKTKVDSFYTSKLSSYTSSLENTIFCNDRSFASGTTGGPLSGETVNSTSYSYYAPYYRIWSSYSPSLQCTNTNDRFSLSTSSGGTSGYGNNKLTYPIGLLTSDEVMLAGGKGGTTNSNYYLYTGKTFWLGSPDAWVTINSFVASVLSTGVLYYYSPANAWGVRPSVSLQPETIYSEGDGTVSSPYKITSQ